MINVFHAFSGVDSQYMAEKRVWGNDGVRVIGTMEVDVDAIISCALIHNNDKFMEHYNKLWSDEDYEKAKQWLIVRNIGFDFEKGKSKLDRMKKDKLKQLYIASVCIKNYGDISLANKVRVKDDIDLFTYSSPCQSFSIAGKQEGLNGVSGLLLECEKFIEINKPKILLLENVKNLVGKKFIGDFNNWLRILDKLGYNSYWKVLNAKDFGIPQNRERVFCLSVRKDIDINGYNFSNTIKLEKDVLEDNIHSKYYYNNDKASQLAKIMIDKYNSANIIPCDSTLNQPKELEVANCITARYDAGIQNKRSIGVAIVEQNRLGGIFDDEKGKHQAGSIWDTNGLAPTLDTMQGGYRQPMILENDKTDKIIIEGNIMPSGHSAGRVINPEGISPTVMENHGLATTIIERKTFNTNQIIKYDIQQQVEVRVHNIDQDELYNFLKSYKIKNNQQIADELGIPKTKVDHWFRNDNSFAIPTRDIWFKLKEVLNIDSDKFDKAIMEFEVRDGVYEKSGRVYHSDGIAPTLTTQGEEKIIVPMDNKLISPVVQDFLDKDVDNKFYNIQPKIYANFKREMTDIISSDKEIYQCECDSGFQDNKIGIKVSPTLRASNPVTHVLDKRNNFAIRKLTPKECWRLMDFDEDAFDKVKDYISDSQLYKQAGNSIVVACLEHIFTNLKEIL